MPDGVGILADGVYDDKSSDNDFYDDESESSDDYIYFVAPSPKKIDFFYKYINIL